MVHNLLSPEASVSYGAIAGDNKSDPLTLRWDDLCFDVKQKRILDNISGTLRPGELTAIMGPSGAGKSTLMNVLAGRAPHGIASGTVSLNREPVSPSQYKRKLAYVMQQDALFATQTPRECLHFTAALRLLDKTEEERTQLVNSLISDLGLTKCADTMIGSVMAPGLSGGEKKRTAVAAELISSPSLIFLDEPTSGLDSHSAAELIRILKMLASKGNTIVCTIHQPSSEVFNSFDKVMLLRDGRTIYSGPVKTICEYFAREGHDCPSNYNPADHAMTLLQSYDLKPMDNKRNSMLRATSNLDGIGDALDTKMAPFFKQLKYLAVREMKQFIRDKVSLGARYVMGIVLAVLVGLIFQGVGDEWGDDTDPADVADKVNNHWGGLVFFAINAMFLAAQPLLLVFPLERPVFMREYTSGTYGTAAYFIAKTFVEIPAILLQQCINVSIAYLLLELNGNLGYLILSMTLLGSVSASTALLLGSATTTVETAMQLVPAIYVPQILFAGFFISSNSIPVYMRWLQYICFLKYGVSLATIVEFTESAVPDNRTDAAAALVYKSDISRDSWWIYVLILLAIFLVFRTVAAVVLSLRSRSFK